MARKKRKSYPLSFSCRSARPSDNEFFWISAEKFLPSVMKDPRVLDRKKIRPAKLEGKINGNTNSIQLRLRGPTSAKLWLNSDMLDLDRPLRVHINGSQECHKLILPDLGVLLEDFWARADRQKLFYARLAFPRL
jgi:hypothetical protein